uniref:Uncharacterized protein n=1 Tax=Arundo donax TaxID=35708 RepID=A0A0A9HMQ3_ARUDO
MCSLPHRLHNPAVTINEPIGSPQEVAASPRNLAQVSPSDSSCITWLYITNSCL